MLLVVGNEPDSNVEGTYTLRFRDVQLVAGFSETVYWSLAEEKTRPYHAINEITNSVLMGPIRTIRPSEVHMHFLVCGGDMCCEIIAFDEIDIVEHADYQIACAALAAEITR